MKRPERLVPRAEFTRDLDRLDMEGSPTWHLERLDAMRLRGDLPTERHGRYEHLIAALMHGLKKGLIRPRQVRDIACETQDRVEIEVGALLVRTGAWRSYAATVPVPRWVDPDDWRARPW